jgi:general secretion pathway protein M
MFKIKLAKREKYVVLISTCLVLLFLLINFAILPFNREKDRLRKGITAKESELKEIASLSAVYKGYQKDADAISGAMARRGNGFTLMSYLDTAAAATDVKDYIKNVNPSPLKGTGPFKESVIEIKLEGINTEQMVNYLYKIENPDDLVFVKRISVTDNKKQEGYLDLIIQVLTYE